MNILLKNLKKYVVFDHFDPKLVWKKISQTHYMLIDKINLVCF